MLDYDKKAVKILKDTYWTSSGWRSEYETSGENFQYAKSKGLMFEKCSGSHDSIIDYVILNKSKISKAQVVDAFLVSLTLRRLDLRSALGSYACSTNLLKHSYKGELMCNFCGIYDYPDAKEDLNVLNFERLKWGGVRHDNPLYIAFDLEQLQKIGSIRPSIDDIEIFHQILKVIKRMPEKATPVTLSQSLKSTFKSNKSERDTVINILGFCGILKPSQVDGFQERFITHKEQCPPGGRNDWGYPVSWWKGIDGVNELALKYWFAKYL